VTSGPASYRVSTLSRDMSDMEPGDSIRDIDPELLARVLSGEATAAEIELVRRAAEQSPNLDKELETLREVWAVAGQRIEEVDGKSAWKAVHDRLEREKSAVTSQPVAAPLSRVSGRRPVRRWQLLAAAASIVLIVGAITLAKWVSSSIGGRRDSAARSTAPTGTPRVFATAPGQRATIALIDGTRVLLSVASQLRVEPEFNERTRHVHLDGEAYFEVAHDSARRFVVHAKNAATHVLGTRFGVRAYRSDPIVTVAVTEGKVALTRDESDSSGARASRAPSASAPSITLVRGSVGYLDALSIPRLDPGANADRLLQWTKGRLVFWRTPLGRALAELERWYDIELRFTGDSIAASRRPLTAEFSTEPLSDVLRSLEIALEVKADRSGHSVTLTPSSRPPSPVVRDQ
jgi:transmembrane sensor